MADLRQVLSQGRKRTAILMGAGAPMAVRVDSDGHLVREGGTPLIPDIAGITSTVKSDLSDSDRAVVETLSAELGSDPTIEDILTKIRRLAQAIGQASVHDLDGSAYELLGKRICSAIGRCVRSRLPTESNPYTNLASWISGTPREHAVEVFTPNYDLLMEEAFERLRLPYFDGFSGSHQPFFDPGSVSLDDLPPRWSRLWKLHGSLGWEVQSNAVVRTGNRCATELVYPDHLKYDQVTRLPYSALFERLREFMNTPDTLLICTGFSFLDAHICAVLDEGLTANAHTAVIAFQFNDLAQEQAACKLAMARPNMSAYCRDMAVIHGIEGLWRPGEPPSRDWLEIRRTFWQEENGAAQGTFLLGDFARLAQFLAWTQAPQLASPEPVTDEDEDATTLASQDAA